MLPIDPLWVYIGVPAVLVFVLVLIKFRQKRLGKQGEVSLKVEREEEVHVSQKESTEESSSGVQKVKAKTESSEESKPTQCPNYLGYLFMKKAPDRTHIPVECYNCKKLLQCLYSPKVIEKVYGE